MTAETETAIKQYTGDIRNATNALMALVVPNEPMDIKGALFSFDGHQMVIEIPCASDAVSVALVKAAIV